MRYTWTKEVSLEANAGGTSQGVAISGTSAQSAAIDDQLVIVTLTVDGFFREGSNPTALSDGTDQFLVGGLPYRIQMKQGNKLAFKTTGAAGFAYITPGV